MNRTILVCCETGCIANGSLAVAEALAKQIELSGADATVEAYIKQTGCMGYCGHGPLVRVMPDDISYYRVKAKDAPDIVGSLGKTPVERLLYRDEDGNRIHCQHKHPFYAPQKKLALRNVGVIDPHDIDDARAQGTYKALEAALTMTPDEIISEVERSGLRGRGGAGFYTGRKWRIAAESPSFPKYVIMNGDEGDPGAFMDRSMLEGDPHSVLEGIAICALAIGAEQAFLYIRDEYTHALHTMRKALDDAEAAGILGDSVLGSEKRLHLSVVRGGGAFVCGESSAMIASIEGGVGEPRGIYVRSTEKGLWGQPTVMNNVETFINIPLIINSSGAEFARVGTQNSKGTKVFALVGKIKRSGLVEVPMGTTLREIVFDIGGGIPGGRAFKAIHTGGPSGGCLPERLLDLPVDFDSLTSHGSMMGSGGMVVMDDQTCMIEAARYNVEFLAKECCGKCVPCREGLRWLLRILTRICEGQGEPGDIALIGDICETLTQASRCGLGKTAANPVLTTLAYFPAEYEEHIKDKRCSAGVCRMGVEK
jgi:NADH-quinone oxidoreductase subunit F